MLTTLAVANYRSINHLLPALARLIIRVSEQCQVWVV
ncbi:ATP-binding protein, partial [Pseudomonas frederiksbergensis]|nr:ATP-binding protein [Pseudomonas frederiksbergensis]